MKKQLIIAAMVFAASSAFSADMREPVKSIALKDGGTVYVFSDGKMATTDRRGRAYRVRPGTMLEAADGSQVTIDSNETSRLETYFHEKYGSGA